MLSCLAPLCSWSCGSCRLLFSTCFLFFRLPAALNGMAWGWSLRFEVLPSGSVRFWARARVLGTSCRFGCGRVETTRWCSLFAGVAGCYCCSLLFVVAVIVAAAVFLLLFYRRWRLPLAEGGNSNSNRARATATALDTPKRRRHLPGALSRMPNQVD